MLYAGIFLLSLSALIFEVSLLRVFSIALWYHFAFMIVSIALLGYACGGTVLMLLKEKARKIPLFILPAAFSLFAPLSYLFSNSVPFDPARFAWDVSQLSYIALYYLALSIPFVFSGMTVALAFMEKKGKAGRVYAADLLGAGGGPLVAMALFPHLGGEGAIVASSAGGFLSSAFFIMAGNSARRNLLLPVSGIAAVSALLLFCPHFFDVKVSPYKALPFALSYTSSRTVETLSNSFSRVDLIESPAVRFAPGLSLKYLEALPPQMGITVDADSLTAITDPSTGDSLKFLDYLPTALPYKLLAGKDVDVFVVDSNGGLHILEALYHGSKRIAGSERNPLVARLANTPFSGFIYEKADIRAGEGRAVLRGTGRKFDIVQIGVASQSPSPGGMYGLAEDYRFTVEAFREYYKGLKDGGLLSVTAYLLPPPREELKLAATLLGALEESGVREPERQLIVFRTLTTVTMVVKKGDLDEGEVFSAKKFLKERRFDAVYYPGITPADTNVFLRSEEPLGRHIASLIKRESRKDFINNYIFNITPSTDERPFFRHFFKFGRLGDTVSLAGGKWQLLLEGGYLLPFVLLQAAAVSSVLLLLPILMRPKKRTPVCGLPGLLAYFFLIGLGFMFVEISLIQRFILFVGHPEYAFSLVVTALLISSGIGSFLSQRLKPGRSIAGVLLLLSALIWVLSFLLPALMDTFLGAGLIPRLLLSSVIMLPVGILMGMALPLGIRHIEKTSDVCIPWAWAVNGCASVVGSVGSGMVAMAAGFKGVLIIAGALYIGAMVLLTLKKEKTRVI